MSTLEKGTPLTYLMTKRAAVAGYATYQPVSKRKGIRGRLVDGFKQRESRRYFFVYFLGKMLGVVALLAAVWAIAPWLTSKAFGSDGYQVTASDLVNPVNTIWVLVTAFLVFFMQAGFMMLEAGFARTRETVQHLARVHRRHGALRLAVLGVRLRVHVRARATDGSATSTSSSTTRRPPTGATGVAFMAFFLFQFAFADTCSTITSGAMVGRTGFKGDILYSIGVSGFIYPIIGHWVWGPDGWLATMKTPFRDFAGSTVVHTIGGMVALAGAHRARTPHRTEVQARRRRHAMPGHDMTIAAVGGVILWFGWYGFNPGSTLSALDFGGMGRVATNTTLAACAGGAVGAVLRLSADKEVGRGPHRQRLPRGPGRDHLSVLLGQPDRRDVDRRDRGDRRGARRRTHGVAADRRSGRSGRRPRVLRHLGNTEPWFLCHRAVRPSRARREATQPPLSRVSSGEAAQHS